jgi:hypothetical protein
MDNNDIFHVRVWTEPLLGCMMKLGTFVDPPDVMNHANFHLHQMNNLRASGGRQIRGFPFEMHMALTTMPCATALASDNQYDQ